MELQSDISRTNSQVSEVEFNPVQIESYLNVDIDLSKPKKKSTFHVEGKPIKILKRLNNMKTNNEFKLNPAGILAERINNELIRVYLNFNPDDRRYIHQIEKYFDGLKVSEVSNQELKNFPKYAAELTRKLPDKYKSFTGAAMANFYNFLGEKVKKYLRTSTKSLSPKKIEKEEEVNDRKKIKKETEDEPKIDIITEKEEEIDENPKKMKKSRSWKEFIMGYLTKSKPKDEK